MPHLDLVTMAAALDELIPRVERLAADLQTITDRYNLLQAQVDDHLRWHSMSVTIPDPAVRSMAEELRTLRSEIETVRNLLPAKPR